jgi:hypothetical protein
VLPVTYSDNDITLWPGESQTIQATYDPSALKGDSPQVSVSGWNVSAGSVHSAAARSAQSFGVADGTPLHSAPATPGQSNTIAVMQSLRKRIARASVKAARVNGRAVVRVSCAGASGAACHGSVRISALVRHRVGRHWRARSVAVGRRGYHVAAGSSETLRLRLPRAVRGLGGRARLVIDVIGAGS